MGKISYKDSGVDIKAGEELVEKIKRKVKSTYGKRVYAGVGGFASLYDMGDRFIAAGSDGVGTKLMVAKQLGIHNTIGIDLVAMCVNDVICTGAKPLFFMDYLACGKLDLTISDQVIDGIVQGCKESNNMALIGGETAEMPGMYSDGDYDLAGFAVGEVMKKNLVDGQTISPGDIIVGLPSTGVHSNGFSLLRQLINSDESELLKKALVPTRLYSQLVHLLMDKLPGEIKGMAHITGGGMDNIQRVNPDFDYRMNSLPSYDEIPEIFSILKDRSGLTSGELYKTFNMGVGFVLIVGKDGKIIEYLKSINEKFWMLGAVCKK